MYSITLHDGSLCRTAPLVLIMLGTSAIPFSMQTKYRKCELNLWSQLKHPNIVPLLGVVMGENIDHQSRHCYQFMPQMKGDLSRMICRKDVFTYCAEMNLEDLKKTSIGLALHNITYIIKEVLKGLVCMEGLNVIHKDIKGNNMHTHAHTHTHTH